jgi:plastocyanin
MARMAKGPRLYLAAAFGLLPAAMALPGQPPAAHPTGTISGVVRFTGKVPPLRDVTVTDGRTLSLRDLVVDSKSNGLRDVVAALEDAPAQPRLRDAEPVLVDQRDMLFLPHVVAVQHGQAVRFENSDLFNHSVMASSTMPENQFNVFVSQGKPVEHTFAVQRHPVQIGCSLHPWMRAWVFVFPHPWFSVSDPKGRFTIRDVPAGTYTLWLRHPDSGLQERRHVLVTPGKTTELTVEWTGAPAGGLRSAEAKP